MSRIELEFSGHALGGEPSYEGREDYLYLDPSNNIALVVNAGLNFFSEPIAEKVGEELAGMISGLGDKNIQAVMDGMHLNLGNLSNKLIETFQIGRNISATAVKILNTNGIPCAVFCHVGITRAYYVQGQSIEIASIDDIWGYPISEDSGRKALLNSIDRVESTEDLEGLGPLLRHLWNMRAQPASYLGNNQVTRTSSFVRFLERGAILLSSPGLHLNLTKYEIVQGLRESGDSVQFLLEEAYNRSKDKTHIRHYEAPISAVMIKATKG